METALPRRSRLHFAVLAACLGALGLAVALGVLLEPDPRGHGTHEQLGFAPCGPMQWWGVPCPGCGVTTALVLAVRGAPLAALRTQPFGLVTLAALVLAAAWAVAGHARGRDLARELERLPWVPIVRWLGTLALLGWVWKLAATRGAPTP